MITGDEGVHDVKLQGDMTDEPRKRSFRKERWQSTRRNSEKRKSTMQAEMKKFRKSSDEMFRKSQLQMKHQDEDSLKAGRKHPIQQLDTLHENQEGSVSRPRGPTYHSLNHNGLEKPKVRSSPMGNTCVRFQGELEDTPGNSVIERESEQRDPDNEERLGENGSAIKDSTKNSELNVDICCVEMGDEGAHNEDWHDTRM